MQEMDGSNQWSSSMVSTNNQAVFNPARAAAYLSISRSKLYVLVAAGALIGRKIGRRTIFLRSDLDTFLASLPALPTKGGA
jgi:excisionase family DNA binding protein